MCELIVPPEPDQLAAVGRRAGPLRRRAAARPDAARRSPTSRRAGDRARRLEDRGHRPARRLRARRRGGATRRPRPGRLRRARPRRRLERVEHWLRTAAGVPGYLGFAIGRTLWGPQLSAATGPARSPREEAVDQIAESYRRAIDGVHGRGLAAEPAHASRTSRISWVRRSAASSWRR